jgi:hypothetical protein
MAFWPNLTISSQNLGTFLTNHNCIFENVLNAQNFANYHNEVQQDYILQNRNSVEQHPRNDIQYNSTKQIITHQNSDTVI